MRLPKGVQEIASVIGPEKAVRLVRNLPSCGSRERRKNLYIPKAGNLSPGHKLVDLIGWSDAWSLCEALGPKTIQPSLHYYDRALDNRDILTLQDKGYEVADIAKIRSCSEKWVQNVIASREMKQLGYESEVIAQALGISLMAISCILDIDVPEGGPVKKNPPPKPPSPQFDLGL